MERTALRTTPNHRPQPLRGADFERAHSSVVLGEDVRNRRRGFTIVELLVVVVVIAILAAITIVSFNGIVGRARDTVLKSDLRGAATQLALDYTNDGSYPSSEAEANDGSGLSKSEGVSFTYVYSEGSKSYCLEARSSMLPNTVFHISDTTGSVQEGKCPLPTIQSITAAQCASMPIFTGSNDSAVREVTDSRGGTIRTYKIAKLADNKCWMLTNLRLGSTSGAITLTPSDSDVASSFTLPQVQTTNSESTDTPIVFGPVPGDTGDGETNYGYLYNWTAATAGESLTTMPAGSGNAAHSICPSGWRLPTGGEDADSDFGQLDIAFGGPGGYQFYSASIPQWRSTGPLRTSFAGNQHAWGGGFTAQGNYGALWSASAYTDNVYFAYAAIFNTGYVYPGDDEYNRYIGFGVRCLLN